LYLRKSKSIADSEITEYFEAKFLIMKASPLAASCSREYRRLEGIQKTPIALILLQNLWKSLILQLTRGSEIQVWRLKTRWGNAWRVYNPHTNSVLSFSSESEVRSWIEDHYYR
jgi:hypothetical protein